MLGGVRQLRPSLLPLAPQVMPSRGNAALGRFGDAGAWTLSPPPAPPLLGCQMVTGKLGLGVEQFMAGQLPALPRHPLLIPVLSSFRRDRLQNPHGRHRREEDQAAGLVSVCGGNWGHPASPPVPSLLSSALLQGHGGTRALQNHHDSLLPWRCGTMGGLGAPQKGWGGSGKGGETPPPNSVPVLSLQGIILVYDITDAKSFENIQNWMKSIKEVGVRWGGGHGGSWVGGTLSPVPSPAPRTRPPGSSVSSSATSVTWRPSAKCSGMRLRR